MKPRIGWVLLAAILLFTPAHAADVRLAVQQSPLAGLRYYDAPDVWDELRAGDALALVREPGNPHDRDAVRLEWRGRMVGYVPKRENAALARQLDLGAKIEARIIELAKARNGRQRIGYELYVTLQ
jgi:hypothetical protein